MDTVLIMTGLNYPTHREGGGGEGADVSGGLHRKALATMVLHNG